MFVSGGPSLFAGCGRIEMKQRTRRAAAFYIMVAPWLLVFLTLGLFPLGYGFYLSFTNYYGFNMDSLKWMGLHNYINAFTDTDAMKALLRTCVFTLINVPLSTGVALMLAVLLNGKSRHSGVYRTIYYLPSIVPAITTVLMWKQLIFSSNGGILNAMTDLLGLGKVNWLGYDFATISLVLMMAWGAGNGILIYLAGLKGIPQEMYESASIDGANFFHRFTKITIPLLTPVIFFNVIIGFINSLQVYLQPILLSGTELLARPIEPNYLYVVHAFQQIFSSQRFAYGMSLLWVLFVAILILSAVIFRTSRYWVYNETE
jgi:multiple sugar transport system permease protein